MADPRDRGPDGPARARSPVEVVRLVRHEEELRVRTIQREAGRARVTTRVEVEPVELAIDLGHEELRVHREPIDPQAGEALAPAALSEDTYDIVLYDEEYAIVRRIVPVERVRVRTVAVADTARVSGTVRREEVELERDDGARAVSAARPRRLGETESWNPFAPDDLRRSPPPPPTG